MLGDAEEASPDLPIRRQPEPIAMTAKRFAHRGDDAQLATPIRERPAFGCLGGIRRRKRTKLKSSLQALEDFAPWHYHFLQPGARRIQRHEFNEPETEIQ